MPRTATERPTGIGFCSHNRGGGKRCGRETDFKPDGMSRYSECPVHRERGMEKSRKRREAAGKPPRKRRPQSGIPGTLPHGTAQGSGNHHTDRLPWALQVMQTSSFDPSSSNFNIPHPAGPSQHVAPPRTTTLANGFSAAVTTEPTQVALNVPLIPTTSDPNPPSTATATDPLLDDIPSDEPQPHQPLEMHDHQQGPEITEADARAALWQEHGETMRLIKEDIDSLLATLWAKDTDPRDLCGMFESLKEDVRQTRSRLLPQ